MKKTFKTGDKVFLINSGLNKGRYRPAIEYPFIGSEHETIGTIEEIGRTTSSRHGRLEVYIRWGSTGYVGVYPSDMLIHSEDLPKKESKMILSEPLTVDLKFKEKVLIFDGEFVRDEEGTFMINKKYIKNFKKYVLQEPVCYTEK